MTKRTLQVLVALAVISGPSFGAVERVVKFQNTVRLGYDDNIYSTSSKTGSAYISDVINLSAKLNFSSRTDALLYWEPEFQYRFDADPETITYQTLYARLNHAVSQRMFLTLSDRFRYQQKEGQTGFGLDEYNQNYFENDLMGSLDYTLNDVSFLTLGLGHLFRIWDDSSYGEWQDDGTGGNNHSKFTTDFSYYRDLNPNKTKLMGGINYGTLTYDGDRGGYDAATLMVGVDQNFSSTLNGFGRLGYTFASVEGWTSGTQDQSTPYVQAGLESQPSARTSLTSSLGYSLAMADNSVYNAQNKFNFGVGARHDVTAKITLSGSFAYIYSFYDQNYANGSVGASESIDVKDNYFTLGLRGSYQVNRNNFVELGYLFRTRNVSADDLTFNDWDGNRFDVSWRLRL